MFAELIGVVNLLLTAVTTVRRSASSARHEILVLRILKVYFVLKDIIDEGEALAVEAGPDPLATLNALDLAEANGVLVRWNEIMDRQTRRLFFIHDNLLGKNHLDVIDPELAKKLDTAIGYKMDRVFTLHQLGSALFFRPMFSNRESKTDTANYVLVFAGVEEANSVVDMEKIHTELDALRSALEKYRIASEKLVSGDDLVSLSQRAREETTM